ASRATLKMFTRSVKSPPSAARSTGMARRSPAPRNEASKISHMALAPFPQPSRQVDERPGAHKEEDGCLEDDRDIAIDLRETFHRHEAVLHGRQEQTTGDH